LNKLLILTPIKHIEGLYEKLCLHFNCTYYPNEEFKVIKRCLENYQLVLTNPNKSQIKFDEVFFQNAPKLKAIFTASTGEDHIDLENAEKRGIYVYSLKNEQDLIKELSSTAELALAFALVSTRKLIPAINHVRNGGWDYEQFIGRQFSTLKIGIIGFGRLGKIFAHYCKSLGANVQIYDPYVDHHPGYDFVESLERLAENSNVISIHVHHNSETKFMISDDFFEKCSNLISIINTSRGEIINDLALLRYMKKNQNVTYCTDVLSNEILDKKNNIILNEAVNSNRIIITPHIGGMTSDGQKKAYNFTVDKLISKYGIN
jgi:D-3-phosphoglycerate dehydrogenase